jgi:hypothetical protein
LPLRSRIVTSPMIRSSITMEAVLRRVSKA